MYLNTEYIFAFKYFCKYIDVFKNNNWCIDVIK